MQALKLPERPSGPKPGGPGAHSFQREIQTSVCLFHFVADHFKPSLAQRRSDRVYSFISHHFTDLLPVIHNVFQSAPC